MIPESVTIAPGSADDSRETSGTNRVVLPAPTEPSGNTTRPERQVATLYRILLSNVRNAPWVMQLLLYMIVGGISAVVNLGLFLLLLPRSNVTIAAPTAYLLSAVVNYCLSVTLVFRHKAGWRSSVEVAMFGFVVLAVGLVDLYTTRFFLVAGAGAGAAKVLAIAVGFTLNFTGRRFLVFPDRSNALAG